MRRWTSVSCFAVVINHSIVTLERGVICSSLVGTPAKCTCQTAEPHALSNHLLDFLYPTCQRNILTYTTYNLWHFTLHISAWEWGCLLWNNSDYSWHLSPTPDFHVTFLPSVVVALMPSCITLCCQCSVAALQQCVQSIAERYLQLQRRDHKPERPLSPSMKNTERRGVRNGRSDEADEGSVSVNAKTWFKVEARTRLSVMLYVQT